MRSRRVKDTEGDACLPPEGVPSQTFFQPFYGDICYLTQNFARCSPILRGQIFSHSVH